MTSDSRCPAVRLIVLNRPELVKRAVRVLREVSPARPHIATDEPWPKVPADAVCCAEAPVDWPSFVTRDHSEKHPGAVCRTDSELMALFELEPRTVMLENDCVPEPNFFMICAEVLARYTQKPSVYLIAGCRLMPGGSPPLGSASYSFARPTQTWSGAWRHYDPQFAARPTARTGRTLGDEE